ncbi:MAG: uracil-DNA glycosylase [Firmicutes bacterium HGW-Firmicutes-13]|nr:MAG: uracil-DNA glycosylase [Firmicutes bacterium HGW-Firmicutes-13]
MEGRIKSCRKCSLRKGCEQVVFGEGNPQARLMLVGEGPGREEDKLGRPFVGAAGKLLDKILESVNIRREEVYIANVVKCRPPYNRTPDQEEVKACYPYLQEQMSIIKPEIIICLGSLSAKTLIDPKAQITRIRGKWLEKDNIKIMPTFHPAALLRDPQKKKFVWQDFQQVKIEYNK